MTRPAPKVQDAALQRAVASGSPVVVDELTTPTELTMALPDGRMRREVSTRPVRVAQGGAWVPVDTDLVAVGDWWVPVASAAPVRFSRGGSELIAQTRTVSGEWVSESSMFGVLPAPVIEGDTATYPEVMPGVDLKLVATKTGMASIYVVKSEAAAKSSGLASLQIAVDGAELTSPDQGRVAATADDGSSLIAAQPLWWDSSGGGTYREPGEEAPPAPVSHRVAEDQLTMDVGSSVAQAETGNAKDLVYPIFVDPDWSIGMSDAWYTDAAYPNASYLTAGASDVLRVGNYAQYRSDMFFEFPLDLAGSDVLYAVLDTTQVATAACPPGWISSHYVTIFTPGYTWDQEQAWKQSGDMWWSGTIDSQQGAGCGAGPTPLGWTMTDEVAAIVDTGAEWVHFGFTGEDGMSRKHFSRDATLIVEYNNPPDVPTDPRMISPAAPCGTAAVPAVVGAGNVTVQVDQTDPDPGGVDTNFDLVKASKLSKVVQEHASGLLAQGPRSVAFTGLTEGVTYAWRARGNDGLTNGVGYTPWCYFTVDTTSPAVPTVSTAATSFTLGAPVNVSLSGASDVAGYVYWVAPSKLTSPAPPVPVDGTVSTTAPLPECDGRVTANVRWVCGAGATPVTVTAAPVDGLSTLWVSAYDRAGNQSAAAGLPLYSSLSSPAMAADVDGGHEWQVTAMTSPLPSTVPDANPWIGAGAVDLLIPAADAAATDPIDPPGSSPVLRTGPLASDGDALATSAAPMNATNSFSLSMWVKMPSVPAADQIVAQQAGTGRGSVQLKVLSTGKYSFCLTGAPAADDNGRPVSNCAAGGTVKAGTWQLVTGVWDAANRQLRLLMGTSMVPVASAGHVVGSGDWSANGPLVLGPPPAATRFSGLVANPAVLPAVIAQGQLAQLAAFSLPFTE